MGMGLPSSSRLALLICVVLSLGIAHPALSHAQEPAAKDEQLGPVATKRIAWALDTTVGAYDRVGDHNPKWDDAAHAVLRAAAATWEWFPRKGGDEDQIMLETGDAAMNAGCADPLVLYAHARAMAYYRVNRAEVAKVDRRALDGFRHRHYPPIRLASSLFRTAEADVRVAPDDADARARARAKVDEAIALMPEVFADRAMPTDAVIGVLEVASDASDVIEKDHEVIVRRVVEAMEHSPLSKSTVLTAQGAEWLKSAWHARGGGFANTVTDNGWRLMSERLAKGRAMLEEAWQLDHNNADAARLMLDAETHGSRGPKVFDTWFRRATAADPDDPRPYAAKLNWLEPKWYGSAEQMLAFGRECARTGRWTALVPLVLVDAHWEIGRYGGPGYPPAPHREYFQGDPKIWDEIHPIYENYLQSPDASNYHKTRYAVIAAYSGQWKIADATFRALGRNRSEGVLYDDNALDALVREAATRASQSSAGEPTPGR
jgi:hypothetical protein